VANALFAKGKQNLLDKKFDLNTDDMRVILVDHADDTPVVATDDALDDILAAARVAVSNALDNPTITDGTHDADNETFTAVTGDQSESLVEYLHTGTEATSFLLVYIDTTSNSSLPVTPNGGDITIQWHASGIFSL
jgi:hypothetical protein